MEPALESLIRLVWMVIAISAGISVMVTALLRLGVDFLPMRRRWQRMKVHELISARPQPSTTATKAPDQPIDHQAALSDLIRLATANQPDPLYDLPIDRLAGQLSAAAQAVLDYPARHKDLFLTLASGANPSDLERLLAASPPAPALAGGAEAASPAQLQELVTFVDARNRVTHQIQRKLDAFQIHMTFQSRAYFQAMALGLGLLTGVLFAWIFNVDPRRLTLLQWVVIGVLGGFLASLLSDGIDALRNRLRAR
jgi:hypothetical protein